MVLYNSEIKLTANIGVCIKGQNLKTLTELSGDALIRGLSFLHYFLKQDSNIKVILNFKESDLFKSINSKTAPLPKIFDQTLSNVEKLELLKDFLEKSYFKAIENTDIAILYKFEKIRNLFETSNPSIETINDAFSKPMDDCSEFYNYANTWLFSLRGLEFTAFKIGALFNEDGDIFYDGENPMLKEHNCPIIASLLH